MKLFGLIAVVLITFSACQKENLRPDCPTKRAPESTETAPQPEANALGITVKPETSGTNGTTCGTNDENNGGGIVDPNADQDASNSVSKAPKKGR